MSINSNKQDRLKRGKEVEKAFEEYCIKREYPFWQFGYDGEFAEHKIVLDDFLWKTPDYIAKLNFIDHKNAHYFEVKTLNNKFMLLKEKDHKGYGIWNILGHMVVYYAIYDCRYKDFIFINWADMHKLQQKYKVKEIYVDKNEGYAANKAKKIPNEEIQVFRKDLF